MFLVAQLELMYFANPWTALRAPMKTLGMIGVSTSAITAMWISVGVTPTSLADGFSLPACAVAAPASDPTMAEMTKIRATILLVRIVLTSGRISSVDAYS